MNTLAIDVMIFRCGKVWWSNLTIYIGEAIEQLKNIKNFIGVEKLSFPVSRRAMNRALDYAMSELEKQIPMKVIDSLRCPNCKLFLGGEGYEQKYCDECGQKLKWD